MFYLLFPVCLRFPRFSVVDLVFTVKLKQRRQLIQPWDSVQLQAAASLSDRRRRRSRHRHGQVKEDDVSWWENGDGFIGPRRDLSAVSFAFVRLLHVAVFGEDAFSVEYHNGRCSRSVAENEVSADL